MTAIRFSILGAPVSHKNGYRIVTLNDRPAIVKSKEAIAWERSAHLQIPVTARSGKKFEERKRDAEQLALLFDEVGQ